MPGMSDDRDLDKLTRMSREQLHAAAMHYYKTGSATVPDVVLVSCGRRQAVLKDYGRTRGWFSRLVAPVLIWREARALSTLDSVEGIPRLYRQLDARALLIEHCPATPWRKNSPGDAAYRRLDELVGNMHAQGVAHCDLRGAGNILVDDQDRPYLIDFVSHIRRGRPWNLPWNWLFRRFTIADQSALAKLRMRQASHLATARDESLQNPSDLISRSARQTGMAIRRIVRLFQSGGQ